MLTFSIGEQFHKFGTTSDGCDFIGSRYYIVATGDRGERLRHFTDFVDTKVHQNDEDGYTVFEFVPEARTKAEQLLNKIQERGTITEEFWDWMQPAYLSDAYMDNYEEYEVDPEEDY